MQIHIEKLTKTYRGGIQALRGVDLEIGPGMFGLLGPNGAGKTTLLRILATLIRPSSGRALVDGLDVSDRRQKWAVKQMLGYLPQELGLYNNLTVCEFLDYMATLKQIHHRQDRAGEVDRLLGLAGLRDQAGQRIKTLSGGMKRRVGIAQALIGNPRLLIVDEPTASLDPQERVRFRTLLAQLAGDRIVLLSTHIVEDIANTCHDMAVLDQGKVRFRGSPEALLQRAEGRTWELNLAADEQPHKDWRIVTSVRDAQGQRLRLLGERPHEAARPVTPTLEEAYLAMMGER